MDTSSELIHALLPLYMVGALGASVLVVGIIEGVAEAIALIVKVFSGYWSDVFRHRKPLVVLGLRARGAVQARVSARADARLGRRRALCRSRRQGHPRRAARCADRRPDAGGRARRGVRLAPGARHASAPSPGRCSRSSLIGVFRRQFPRGVLGRRRARAALCVALLVFGVREAGGGARGDRGEAGFVARRAAPRPSLLHRDGDRVGADARALLRGVPRPARAGRRHGRRPARRG